MTTTVKNRRQTLSQETRELLTSKAMQLFARRSYDQISVDDIAVEAGVTKGAFYHHFPAKIDIFETCYRNQIQSIASRLSAIRDPERPLEWAHSRIDAFLSEVLKNGRQMIGLDTAITVLGWTQWRNIDKAIFLPLIEEPLVALDTCSPLQSPPVEVGDMIHAMMFNSAMMIAHSPTPKKTLISTRMMVQRFLQSVIEAHPEGHARQ